MTNDELRALAERVEALTGADRETDLAVFNATSKSARRCGAFRWAAFGGAFGALTEDMKVLAVPAMYDALPMGYRQERLADIDPIKVPSPTASIDAAMTLVPEGHAFDVSFWHPTYGTRANVLPLYQDGDRWLHRGADPVFRAKAATPALALTAAALRAWAEQLTDPTQAKPGGDNE